MIGGRKERVRREKVLEGREEEGVRQGDGS